MFQNDILIQFIIEFDTKYFKIKCVKKLEIKLQKYFKVKYKHVLKYIIKIFHINLKGIKFKELNLIKRYFKRKSKNV